MPAEPVVEYVAAVFLLIAVVCAFLRGFGVDTGRGHAGWIAVGCLIVSVWLLPALLVVGRLHP